MSVPLYLAIDQGGQSTRLAIYAGNGEQIFCVSSPCATFHRHVDSCEYIEQDPAQILLGITSGLERIADVLGDRLKDLVAAGFAGQGSSLLCWDNQTGEALSPVLSWQDIRGQSYLASLDITHQTAQQLTGLRLSPHYGASKIRWCLDNILQVAKANQAQRLTIGPIVSYILFHLTGKSTVDSGHAQRTLLWNLHKNAWDESLLKLFSISPSLLPILQSHCGDFGSLSIGGHSIPMRVCARDQGASLFAYGTPLSKFCYVNIGTGAFIQRPSNQLIAPDGILVSPLLIRDHAPPLYCWEATVNGAASAIHYLQLETGLAVSIADIERALNVNPKGECYFLNSVGGLSAPYWRTDLQSQFSAGLDSYEKILAWLESIIFQIAVNVELMKNLGALEKIIISGGFSNADQLCQKLANVVHLPVVRLDNTDATLMGIAHMASNNIVNDSEVNRFNENRKMFNPIENTELQKRFLSWSAAMETWMSSTTT